MKTYSIKENPSFMKLNKFMSDFIDSSLLDAKDVFFLEYFFTWINWFEVQAFPLVKINTMFVAFCDTELREMHL